jgi:hypothetical protein
MGVVTINGQRYDSVTGLKVDEPDQQVVKSIEINTQDSPVVDIAPKQRRRSKQERLAEAIAREFDDDELGAEIAKEVTAEPVAREVPEWISQFTEVLTEQKAEGVIQPDWITNYVSGGDPVEIQPIGLEAAARDAAREQSEAKVEKIRQVQHNRARTQERSRTLNRNFVQKPNYVAQASAKRRSPEPTAKHPEVHRFAPVKVDVETTVSDDNKTETPFAPVMTHSMEEKLAQGKVTQTTLASSDLKNVLINEQMDQPIDRKARIKAERKASRTRRRFAAPTIVTAALAVLILGGYFTYVSMPSISVRVAAARAGVDAHAPYTPNGYSIDGPVAYAPGSVTINFKSNGGGNGYSLIQQNNTWGDGVVLDSLVENSDYAKLEAGQVTIYRYGDKAAWIDRNILFTLSGNEYLADDQIIRIAESI